MTENEYIKVKDLGHIISAKDCLRHVIPDTSEYITKEEYETVMKIISLWETKHFVNINLKTES